MPYERNREVFVICVHVCVSCLCAFVPEDSSSLSQRADRIPTSSIMAVQRILSVSHRERQCPLIQLRTRARTAEDAANVCMCEWLGGWNSGLFSASVRNTMRGPVSNRGKMSLSERLFFFFLQYFCAFESLNPWWENHFTTCQFFKCNTSRKSVRLR